MILVNTKVETAATDYHFDRIMVIPNNLVNRIIGQPNNLVNQIIYSFLTLERIAILDLIQTCILQQYEYTYSIRTYPMYLLPLILICQNVFG